MARRAVDLVAVGGALLAAAMVVAYVAVMGDQDDTPAVWVVAVLVVGAVAAGYGSVRRAPYRRVALLLAGVVLLGLGLLAILTIGLPILVAGGLCVLAAARADG